MRWRDTLLTLAASLLAVSLSGDVTCTGAPTSNTRFPPGCGSGQTTLQSLSTGLSAYWTMNEVSGNRADSTANALTLTDNNTVTSAAGLIGNEATFLNANQESLSHTHTALLAPTTSFTIAGWFRCDATTGVTEIFVDKSDPTTGGMRLARANSGNVQFSITGGGSQTLLDISGGLMPVSTRVFIVGWLDTSAGTLNLQVNNGTVNSSATSVTPAYDPSIAFRIGCNSNGTSSCITGAADEVGLWSLALSAAQRTTLYNGGAGRTYSSGSFQ